jgi:hypothetical protein
MVELVWGSVDVPNRKSELLQSHSQDRHAWYECIMLIVARCVYTLAGRASCWHAVVVGCDSISTLRCDPGRRV